MLQSQFLIVDTIQTWRCGPLGESESIIELDTTYGRLSLVTREPEYFGNAEFEIRILWDKEYGIDEHPPSHLMIHELMRSFIHQWKVTIKVVRHEGLTTIVELKTTDKTENHSGWDWVDVIAPKADPV